MSQRNAQREKPMMKEESVVSKVEELMETLDNIKEVQRTCTFFEEVCNHRCGFDNGFCHPRRRV